MMNRLIERIIVGLIMVGCDPKPGPLPHVEDPSVP